MEGGRDPQALKDFVETGEPAEIGRDRPLLDNQSPQSNLKITLLGALFPLTNWKMYTILCTTRELRTWVKERCFLLFPLGDIT